MPPYLDRLAAGEPAGDFLLNLLAAAATTAALLPRTGDLPPRVGPGCLEGKGRLSLTRTRTPLGGFASTRSHARPLHALILSISTICSPLIFPHVFKK
jgi:hypothetical protein